MIEARGLTKRYGTLTALDNLSLDIGPGEVFGFIGPNGAGKTTSMKILSCLLKPDSGSAKVAGYDIRKDSDSIRRVIGYMPDFLGVYDDLTVDEYLQFFGASFGIPRSKRPSIIAQVLELTDLTEKRHANVDSLSRGMQQRLGVARVLVHDPKVLFLDEPASGLDPRARIEMRSLLVELGKMGKTLMVSSHILSELAEMCTSIGIVERGKLLYAGSIADAYERTRAASQTGDRVVIELEPEGADAIVVKAALENDPRVASVKCDGPRTSLVVDLAPGTRGHHVLIELVLRAGGRISAFRPEQVRLEDAFLKLTTGALQ
jgi:ABC-2 type transport system ATP-binding protein